jgi:hypothetical protein
MLIMMLAVMCWRCSREGERGRPNLGAGDGAVDAFPRDARPPAQTQLGALVNHELEHLGRIGNRRVHLGRLMNSRSEIDHLLLASL